VLEITFVGTGDAFCSGGRRNSAILLREGKRTLLLDCGPTTMNGLQALGVDPREIDAVAISHFHGDHAGGVPFLLLHYLYEHPRKTPLDIIGPPGIEAFTLSLSEHLHFQDDRRRGYALRFREFERSSKLESAGFKLQPVPAFHHPETRPHMLRVGSEHRSVFFTGDTGWHEGLPGHVGDSDLLISECTLFDEGFEYHLSHARLHRERKRFETPRILLTHLGQPVLEQLSQLQFDSAYDGMRVHL
jgi:ribonuclease BN (tRNA processing enzyme)